MRGLMGQELNFIHPLVLLRPFLGHEGSVCIARQRGPAEEGLQGGHHPGLPHHMVCIPPR